MKRNWDIDNFFKQKLADPVNETGYREEDWGALEKMMDKGKRQPRIVYWLPILSGVAATFLMVLGWWLFKPNTNNEPITKQQIIITPKNNNSQPSDPTYKNNSADTTPLFAVEDSLNKKYSQEGITQTKKANIYPSKSYVGNINSIAVTGGGKQNLPLQTVDEKPVVNETDLPIAQNVIIKVDTTSTVLANNIEKLPVEANTEAEDKGMAAKVKKNSNEKSIFGRPQFALTIMGAPDLNGVNSFSQSKTGTNLGLLFSASFNKLTVSTGVAYSFKPYNVAFADYSYENYYFRTKPISVLADCRMLDIPLNFDYQLFNKNKNKISIGTGLSSYIMLRENYVYEYAYPNARGPRSYSVVSPGKYFFGVVNLQATYQRQVNSKMGVTVQPYFKLPLGEVGAGKVRLQSAGVALGVSWNINPLKKK